MHTIQMRHIDTCTSDYVLDHCNGEHETLVGIAVDGSMTYGQVKAALVRELETNDDARLLTLDEAALIEAATSQFVPMLDNEPFAPGAQLELEEGDTEGDTIFAWFRFQWVPA